jgi:hypothetical protein
MKFCGKENIYVLMDKQLKQQNIANSFSQNRIGEDLFDTHENKQQFFQQYKQYWYGCTAFSRH